MSEIRNPDGSVVFRLDDIEVPAAWSQVATDVLAQKYFRKAGVPARLKQVEENAVPSFLWRSVPDEAGARRAARRASAFVSEIDARQVFDRLAGTWTYWGWKGGYFAAEEDAPRLLRRAPLHARHPEGGAQLAAMVQHRPALGLWHRRARARAITTSTSYTGKLVKSKTAYEHPQPHACFIQSVSDDLVNEGGIMDLWVREARLFKYGSGTGSNFSRLRGEGERLSGGGSSSGLMSFLKIGDRAAGAIKSGGTTRRAAKMVVVDVDHPDIEDLHRLEGEGGAEGRRARHRLERSSRKHLNAIMKACVNCEGPGDDCFDPAKNPALKREIRAREEGARAGELHPARHPVRPAGLHRRSSSRSTTPTGIRRPTSPSPARTPTTRCASPTISCARWRRTATGS